VIDAFVDALDLADMGFDGVEPEATGRPANHPSTHLKLYIYGYLYRVQSSRRLEREAGRNVEVMWLLRRLMPDHSGYGSAHVVRRRQWTPKIGRNFAVPVLWPLRGVVMPRPGIEIAEFFVLHLVELDVELHVLVVGVSMVDRDVVPRPMTHRPPIDRHLAERKQLAGILDVGEILHLESDVMHLVLRASPMTSV
jgi:hypothetical protein